MLLLLGAVLAVALQEPSFTVGPLFEICFWKDSMTVIDPPPAPPGTKWTRRVPHPVPIGHAASLTPY
jgi:hypothetical protein